MEDVIKVTKVNEVFLHISTDQGISCEIEDRFKFMVPGAKYSPKYKSGVWDGYIRIFSQYKRMLPIGLYSQLVEFANSRDYALEVVPSNYGSPEDVNEVDPAALLAYVKSLNVHSRNVPIEVRSYQLEALYKAIKYKRKTILSPTGSGKSYIIYCMMRYISEMDGDGTTLIICPTTALVEQMYNDFGDYSSEVSWSNENECHRIYSGHEKITNKHVIISTWQSLMRLDKSWFSRFNCVIVDEVHGAKSIELQNILEKCVNADMRYGLTGSLDNSSTHHTMIQGMLGDIIRVAKTRDLIDEGHLSEVKISSILLDYSKVTKKAMQKVDYMAEIEFLISHPGRNKFITKLALSLPGNTLILFARVEKHGKVLHDMIKEKSNDTPVFFIHGGVDVEDRAVVGQVMRENKTAIAVASVGTFAVGINIPEINNVIFASPTKSVIRVLQSIGRGLRKSAGKDHFKLFDIGDRLSNSKTKPNHTYQHFIGRLEIYAKEEFSYKITTVKLEGE